MKIKYATISKTGRRSNNEDCFNVLEMPEHNRFMGIVCDGMGGHSFQKGDRILLWADGLYKSMAPDILQARMLDENPWKIYSMYLTFSVKNKVMTTIRQY